MDFLLFNVCSCFGRWEMWLKEGDLMLMGREERLCANLNPWFGENIVYPKYPNRLRQWWACGRAAPEVDPTPFV